MTSVNTLPTLTSRPPARPARIPLTDTLCGYRTIVSVSSALQAAEARLWLVKIKIIIIRQCCLLCAGRYVTIIYLVGNVSDVSRMIVQLDTVDASKYVRTEKLCKYFYDVREWYDPDTVIARATNVVGSSADRLPYKDPQHFATWCKTGSYQLHC